MAVTNFAYSQWNQTSGAEGNSLLRVDRFNNGPTKLYLLAGTKSVNLEEDITLTYTAGNGNARDEFHTKNQFFGGQAGILVTHEGERVTLDVVGKLGLGNTFNQLWVLGSNTAGAGAQAFTGPANIGYYESNYFGVIPELDGNVSYRLTDRLSAHVGYNFLAYINAWRPGKDLGAVYLQCNELFQSGCYHGVIQAFFAWEGTDSAKVVRLCRENPGISDNAWLHFQCVHGIGHGLLQTYTMNLPRALHG